MNVNSRASGLGTRASNVESGRLEAFRELCVREWRAYLLRQAAKQEEEKAS